MEKQKQKKINIFHNCPNPRSRESCQIEQNAHITIKNCYIWFCIYDRLLFSLAYMLVINVMPSNYKETNSEEEIWPWRSQWTVFHYLSSQYFTFADKHSQLVKFYNPFSYIYQLGMSTFTLLVHSSKGSKSNSTILIHYKNSEIHIKSWN